MAQSSRDSGSDFDSPPTSPAQTYCERHPSLYYDDGTVVLSGLTQKGYRQHFRVHMSILARHSPVLADLFSIPPLLAEGSTTKIAETYDGVVHVQMPDTVDELISFLTMFYDPL